MKKLLAVILCVVFVCCLFSGCGSSSNNSSNTTTAGDAVAGAGSGDAEADSAPTDPAAKAIADRIADAQKTGKYPEVTMAFMNFTGAPSGVHDVEAEISKNTEKSLGLDVKLNILDVATYKQQMTLMLSSGENLDLFSAISLGYSSCINNGYCVDLEKDSLISTYGKGILDTMDKTYIDGCRVGGVLYGLPNQRDMAGGLDCFAIGAQYLDGIGFDYKSLYKNPSDEIIHSDIATINDIFSKLHQKYPDKTVYGPQAATLLQANNFDPIGGDNFGVLLNDAQDLKVQDLFSSDTYINFCNRIYQWNKAGYISKDAMTNNIGPTAQVKANTTMAYATAGKPGIRAQESGLCGQPMIIFQLGKDFLKSGGISGFAWCVNTASKDPVAAMQFLNSCYSDPVISDLLCWGIEGKHYKVTSDGHIDFADGVDASSSTYFNNVNWELPNQFIAKIFAGNELTIWDRMKDFNANATVSKAVGFTFNNTSVSAEYTALTNIYTQYQKQMEYGFTDPKVGIPEMVEKMKSAGLQKYMDTKQSQLDSWAKK